MRTNVLAALIYGRMHHQTYRFKRTEGIGECGFVCLVIALISRFFSSGSPLLVGKAAELFFVAKCAMGICYSRTRFKVLV